MKLFEKGHLTDAAMRCHLEDELGREESLAVAGHIAECSLCLDRFTELVEQNLKAPEGISEYTRLRLSAFIERRKREFAFYCVRVSACACIAVALLFFGLGNFSFPKENLFREEDVVPPMEEVVYEPRGTPILDGISQFAEKTADVLLNMSEVFNYD